VTPFLLATFAGTLLGIATFVSVGASLDVNVFRESGLSPDIVDWRFGLLSAIIFVVSIGASKLSKRWKVDA
jgi:membrane protein DedA with SNARE-associated domain